MEEWDVAIYGLIVKASQVTSLERAREFSCKFFENGTLVINEDGSSFQDATSWYFNSFASKWLLVDVDGSPFLDVREWEVEQESNKFSVYTRLRPLG